MDYFNDLELTILAVCIGAVILHVSAVGRRTLLRVIRRRRVAKLLRECALVDSRSGSRVVSQATHVARPQRVYPDYGVRHSRAAIDGDSCFQTTSLRLK